MSQTRCTRAPLSCQLAAIVVLLAFCAVSRAENPYVLWASSKPGMGGRAALGASGELTILTDPWAGTAAALVRFDSQGHPIRTNKLEGVVPYQVSFTFDSADNLYLTGRIETNGLFNVTQVNGFFVAKFGPTNQLLWVRSQDLNDTPNHDTRGDAIAVDGQGNVIVGGYADGPVSFENQSFAAGQGPVVLKFDRDGQLLWAKRVECTFSGPWPGGGVGDVFVDSSGYVVFNGFLREGTADFWGTNLFPGSSGHSFGGDFFIARLNPSGDLQWAGLGYGGPLAGDNSGDIYAAWTWGVDGLSGLAKFNPAGNLLWSVSFTNAYVNGLDLDANGDPVFGGELDGTATFGGTTLRTKTAGWTDFFVAKADGQGNIQWAISGGGSYNDPGGGIVCDATGNIYLIGGVYESVATFGGWSIVPVLQGGVLWTSFVAKIAQKPPLQLVRSAQNVTLSWPVGATNYLLEATTSLPAVSWTMVTNTPTVTATNRSVKLPLTGPAQFFRLRQP